jgi:hypothetical protein
MLYKYASHTKIILCLVKAIEQVKYLHKSGTCIKENISLPMNVFGVNVSNYFVMLSRF